MKLETVKKGVNLHAYQSFFTHETRMLKETQSLVKGRLFEKVFIGAIWKPGLQLIEKLDNHRTVWRVPLATRWLPESLFWKAIKFFEWEVKLFLNYRKEDIMVFNAHSLIVLPLGVLFKMFKKCKLVYDTHELETEVQMRRIQKRVYKVLERLLMPYVDITVVVSDSIKDWYRNRYKLEEVYVIKNVPHHPSGNRAQSRGLRDHLGIANNDLLFIYQGILEKGRGIELILECFAQADRRKHIVLMGLGRLEPLIKDYEKRYPNVHFHDAVSPSIVIEYVCSADVGISLIENSCLNYYYSLPNKLFEYLFSGIPAIVSDFPEMSKVIEEGQWGWAIPVKKDVLLNLVNVLSREEIQEKKRNALKAKNKYGWHIEEEKLLKIYSNLFASP